MIPLSSRRWFWPCLIFLLPPISAIQAVNFQIGSSPAEVILSMNPPDSRDYTDMAGEEIWNYGFSTVTFREGRVWGWDNRARNLNVFLGQAKEPTPLLGLGASWRAVVNTLGTPDAINGCEEPDLKVWVFGATYLTLRRERLVEWFTRTVDVNIIPRLPSPPVVVLGLGATKDQIRSVLGSPGSMANLLNLEEEIWSFLDASITFKAGKVIGWVNKDDILPFYLGCRRRGADRISLGSTPIEVVDCLGTPLEIIPLEGMGTELWSYSFSTVTFRQGQVVSWNNLGPRYVKKRIKYYLPEVEYIADDSVKAWAYPLEIAATRIPRVNRKVTFPTPLMRDEQGRAWPYVAEDGSFYGEFSTQSGLPKTTYVTGFFRADDTYVRSHFRCTSGYDK
jgi:hypothetical protein